MGLDFAYGKRENINSAIEKGVITKESLIITCDDNEAEMLYYCKDGVLRTISERNKFETLTDAQIWAKKYSCCGDIFVVHNGSDWVPYVVQDDCTLKPFESVNVDITDITRIDGGYVSEI